MALKSLWITALKTADSGYLTRKLADVAQNVVITFPLRCETTVTWINVDGLHQVELVENLCKCFGRPSSDSERSSIRTQRPKIEEIQGYLYTLFSRCFLL